MEQLGIESKPFTLKFGDNWIKKDYLIIDTEGVIVKVLTDPKRKWYKLILQVLTLGIYKAPWQYIVVIDPELNTKWKS